MFHLGMADMHAFAIRTVIVRLKSVSKSGKAAAHSPLVVVVVVDYDYSE